MLVSTCLAFWVASPTFIFCQPVTGQAPSQNPLAVSTELDSRGIRGSLIISGGGKPDPIIKDRFIALAGKSQARLVIIPTASITADDPGTDHGSAWQDANPSTLSVLHTRDRKAANDPKFVQPLQSATAVWFSGGSQSRFCLGFRLAWVW